MNQQHRESGYRESRGLYQPDWANPGSPLPIGYKRFYGVMKPKSSLAWMLERIRSGRKHRLRMPAHYQAMIYRAGLEAREHGLLKGREWIRGAWVTRRDIDKGLTA